MNEEILNLVKEYGDWNGETVEMNDVGIIAFYKAAFNAGLEAAAQEAWNLAANVSNYRDADCIRDGISALEMK